MTSNLPTPHLEAEIYYLTEAEGGRKTPVASGYRGQFYYDGKDWDAPQVFIDKEWCNPGEKVKVQLTTASPFLHFGKFETGKTFKVREGARTVGEGVITKVLHNDFNYWDYDSFFKQLPSECIPYDTENITGFITEFEYGLSKIETIKSMQFVPTLDKPTQMLTVICVLKDNQVSIRPLLDEVYDIWTKELRFRNAFSKIEAQTKSNGFRFELHFATWHSMYLTGKIVVDTETKLDRFNFKKFFK